jgi:glutamate-ammonia-ligase adenylyltransferase
MGGFGVSEAVGRLDAVKADVIRPLSQAEARTAAAALKEIAGSEPDVAALLKTESPLKQFLVAAFSLSPFLRDAATVRPALLSLAINEPPEPALQALIADARNAWRPVDDRVPSEGEVMTKLRTAKRAFSFLLALADLARVFSARQTTHWLSLLAEACTASAIDHLLLAASQSGKLTLADPAEPSRGSGLIVLGMGKLGGRELNYSSDIDIVVFYDPEMGVLEDPLDASETYGRMMRRLIRILQERTADGYVFRTDLRLRPDPGSTPLAVSVDAALVYYEGRGQNWERAAYIKARPVAGDMAAGENFMRLMTPFVFRKYLDYAAIADIHSIKRQIHAHKGHDAIAVKGHDIKLGRGGIREIEFFAQTQQLIAGGRMLPLRARETEAALAALAQARWISSDIAAELTGAYWFLRDVEHRIQMVHDEQTHSLPTTDAELKRIALMMGFVDIQGLSAKLETVLKTVEKRYARLFEQETRLSSGTGNLVFTGQQDDPETLKTLSQLGFQRPADMSRLIRTWHYGRYRATQSAEARERLTELTPELLKAFGQSRRADEALLRFDSFLKGLPAGIQLFSLIANNPPLLALIVTIMSSAPRLADIVASRPHVFDGMLDPGLMAELPTRDYLSFRLNSFLGSARYYEERLDRLRIFAAEQRFLIGVRLLTGAISGEQAGRALTHLADLLIEAALKAVSDEIEATHGRYPGGRVVVMGMGKLGSFELTAGSDVDIILLYDYDDGAVESLGPKPLDVQRYFTRLTQRLIAGLSAPMAEGIVFEVDMRLRPSGNKGPVATRINAFRKYQQEEAWTWEHMALTRARLICGEPSLMAEARQVIDSVLEVEPDLGKIAADVGEMRALIDKEKPARDIWDLKLIPGGLIDIEFIAQYLRLIAPTKGPVPQTYGATTKEVIDLLGEMLLAPSDRDTVLEALRLFSELSQIIRLCVDGPFDPADAPAGLIERLCRVGDCPDIRTLQGEVKRLSKAVRSVFDKTIKAGLTAG